MKINWNTLFTLLLCFLMISSAAAQTGMEEYFYESGKIKVVVGVAAIVLLGLLIYLWRLDKRVSKMENQRKGGKS